jgi:F-box and WD-40 domain protein CDC4
MNPSGIEKLLACSDIQHREKTIALYGHSSTVRHVKAISASEVISSSRDSTLRIWNIKTGECGGVLEGHTGTVSSFAVHGDLVALASYDCDGRLWSLESQECVHILKGQESQIYSVAFDGTRVVTGSLDQTARVWDPKSGYVLPCFKLAAS